ncbi:MAG: hypothetical protein ACPGVD_00275 [Flavobacteriales bacterium]
MKNLIFITFLVALFACESVKFKEQVLYDKYEVHPPTVQGDQVVFSDGVGTMWNSLFDCGDFEISDKVAFKGKSSIKLSWNKGNCEWIGFGNSFNNWQPVDLSQERFKKALSFYVRTQSKTAKAIPIVANLEDFGGGGSYYFIDAGKYLYGLEIDTTWKRIVVPLWHFPIDEEEVDINSIKQMQFQLEGAGSFYLDEIEIVSYSKEEYAKSRAEVEKMRPKGKFNQIVYREGNFKEDVWGYENNRCQELSEKANGEGDKYIHWKYDAKDCSWAKWGMNWNGWYAVNLRGVSEESTIRFNVKAKKGSQFKVILEDYLGHKTEIFSHKSQKINSDDWSKISIPLKNLNLGDKKFALDRIKQIYFEGTSKGEVFIDEIKITK